MWGSSSPHKGDATVNWLCKLWPTLSGSLFGSLYTLPYELVLAQEKCARVSEPDIEQSHGNGFWAKKSGTCTQWRTERWGQQVQPNLGPHPGKRLEPSLVSGLCPFKGLTATKPNLYPCVPLKGEMGCLIKILNLLLHKDLYGFVHLCWILLSPHSQNRGFIDRLLE